MVSLYKKYLPELLRQLLLEQVDTARTILLNKTTDFNDVVHDVRTGFKKIRAYLLLLKTELAGDVFKTASRNFRAEGKGIAELRDSYVVVMTLEQLVAQYPDRLQNNTVKNIQNNLAVKYETHKKSALQHDARPLRQRGHTNGGRHYG